MQSPFVKLLLLAALAGFVNAQEKAGPAATGVAQGQDTARAAPPVEPTVTVRFEGGTLAEFVAEVSRASPNVNIVAAEQCREVRLPAITLKEARVGDARLQSPIVGQQQQPLAIAVKPPRRIDRRYVDER